MWDNFKYLQYSTMYNTLHNSMSVWPCLLVHFFKGILTLYTFASSFNYGDTSGFVISLLLFTNLANYFSIYNLPAQYLQYQYKA